MKYLILSILILLSGCSAKDNRREARQLKTYHKYRTFILDSEDKALEPAKKVMLTVRKMVENREVIRGACWDYLNIAFNRAGYPHSKRKIVFKSQKSGPYLDISLIQEGDWLYHINHSYNGIEHSGMFIGWTNRSRKEALMLSYAGEGRAEPARYKVYDLSSVYHIMRAE